MKTKRNRVEGSVITIGPDPPAFILGAPAPPHYDADILRRRIALDQRRSPVVTGEERERWWDTIPMASSHEQSRAIACPALLAGELW